MRILIGYDGSQDADGALRDLESAGLPPKGEFLVVSCLTPWTTFASDQGLVLGARMAFPDSPVETRALAARMAEAGAVRLRRRFPAWKVKARGEEGEAASVLLDIAEEWKPDLIVVGSHGRSALGRMLLGSVSQKVLHHARVSVRVTRPGTWSRKGPPRLLVATDGSRGAEAAIAAVVARSWPPKTVVRLVASISSLPQDLALPEATGWSRRSLDERRAARFEEVLALGAGVLAGARLDVETRILKGDPREVLLKEAKAWEADTLFLGSRGLGALDRFLIGSVSSTLAGRAGCTVEVVRGTGRGAAAKKRSGP